MRLLPATGGVYVMSAAQSGTDSRVAAILSIIEDAFGPPNSIMPGPGCARGRSIQLPPIKTFFVQNRNVLYLLRAMLQRARNALLLLIAVLRARPTVCVCIEPDSWIAARIAQVLFGTRVVVDLMEYYLDRANVFPKPFRGVVRKTLQLLMKLLARKTDLIIHVSAEREYLYRWLSASRATSFMTYPDLNSVRSCPRVSASSRIRVVHAGALRGLYAGAELLHAMVFVHNQNLNCVLEVWGGVLGMEDHEEEIKELVASGALVLHRQAAPEQMLSVLPTYDIGLNFVLPVSENYVYAQPRKLYEYMAAAVPVVGSDVPTISRVLRQHDCGLVVDARNPREIADGILELAADIELRKRLGRNGQDAIRVQYNAVAERERLVTALRPVMPKAW